MDVVNSLHKLHIGSSAHGLPVQRLRGCLEGADLDVLDLSELAFDDFDLVVIAEILGTNRAVTSLSLRGSAIGDLGATALGGWDGTDCVVTTASPTQMRLYACQRSSTSSGSRCTSPW